MLRRHRWAPPARLLLLLVENVASASSHICRFCFRGHRQTPLLNATSQLYRSSPHPLPQAVELRLAGDEASDFLNFVVKDEDTATWFDLNGTNFQISLRGPEAGPALGALSNGSSLSKAGGSKAAAAAAAAAELPPLLPMDSIPQLPQVGVWGGTLMRRCCPAACLGCGGVVAPACMHAPSIDNCAGSPAPLPPLLTRPPPCFLRPFFRNACAGAVRHLGVHQVGGVWLPQPLQGGGRPRV